MKLCHCGKPLHYNNSFAEAWTNAMIKEQGEFIGCVSPVTDKTYKVSRHYIALHGLKNDELHKLGFEEVV